MESKKLFEDKYIGYHTLGLLVDNCVKKDESNSSDLPPLVPGGASDNPDNPRNL